jgi:hypothetical protein
MLPAQLDSPQVGFASTFPPKALRIFGGATVVKGLYSYDVRGEWLEGVFFFGGGT